MNRMHLPSYNFDTVLLGGQSFSWHKKDQAYIGLISTGAIKIVPDGDYILWQTYPKPDDEDYVRSYLNLDGETQPPLKDPHITSAYNQYRELQILNQPFEDALVGFLCSATKSIVGIRQCVYLLSEKFGEAVDIYGEMYNLFPSINSLAVADEAAIRECKVGFRAPNILNASRQFIDGSLDVVGLEDEDLIRDRLTELRGIGNKVADCIMVYGLGFNDITPLDVWGKRVAVELYNLDESLSYEEMRVWFSDYFEGQSSLAAQYLFEYLRHDRKGGWINPPSLLW